MEKKNTKDENKLEEKALDSFSDEEIAKKKNRRKIINIVSLSIFLIGCVIATILLWPYLERLNSDQAYQQQFQELIDSWGIWGVLIIILAFMIQAILAILPSFVFEMIAGLMYGTWIGLLLCLIGSTLGSVLVIILVRVLGKDFANTFVDMSETHKYKILDFINDEKRTELIMFSILLMPGMPKDFIAFIVPFTKVKTWKYVVINIIARIPSTIVTAMFGNAIKTGNSPIAIVLVVITVIVSLIFFIFNKQIVNLITKTKQEE